MHTEIIKYQLDNKMAEGFVAWEKDAVKKPAILIAHDWTGRNAFACDKAEQLAKLGYVAFALDMYGAAVCGNTKEEKSKLIEPLIQNRQLLLDRMLAGLATVKEFDMVDQNNIAAIGFCFGGLCVLDLARSGVAIKGVVSFHGLLNAPGLPAHDIKTKVLVLHGHDDPMVPLDQVLAFQKEMTDKQADWEMNIYGHTMHGFMNPNANDPNFGTVYKPQVAQRAWQSMQAFLTEIFS